MTITIPFPAWEGIFQINNICDELRRNEVLRGIPVHRTPRRITIKDIGTDAAILDDVKVIEYWFPGGCYATVTTNGDYDIDYGTSWTLTSLRLRWKDEVLELPEIDEKVELRLSTEQIVIVGHTSYLRMHLRDHEGQESFAEAKVRLAEAEKKSAVVAEQLATSIRIAHERQQ